jgi:hypothetical protein
VQKGALIVFTVLDVSHALIWLINGKLLDGYFPYVLTRFHHNETRKRAEFCSFLLSHLLESKCSPLGELFKMIKNQDEDKEKREYFTVIDSGL